MAKKKKPLIKPVSTKEATVNGVSKASNFTEKSASGMNSSASWDGNWLEKLSPAQALGLFSGLLFVLLVWVYRSFIWGKLAYVFRDIGSDSYNLIYPQFYHHAAYIQKYGSMPQWSFQQGFGQNVHPFWFDPISSILFFIFGTDSASVMIWMQLIYVFLAGVVFFLYFKTLKIKNFPAIVGGLLLPFCGYVTIGGTWTVDKFPLEVLHVAMLLYNVELYLSRKQWFLFPITIALIGIHQPFDLYLYGIMLAVYITARYAETKSIKSLDFVRHIGIFLLLSAIGIGMGSFQLWSNLQQMIDSPRVGGDSSYADALHNFPILSPGEWKQYSTVLLRMFSSDFLGDGTNYTGWQNYMEAPVFYCGLLSLLLAPQFFFTLSRKQQIIYGVVTGLSLLIILFPYFRYAFWLFTGDYYRTISLLMVCMLLFFSVRGLNYIYETGRVNLIALAATSFVLLLIVNVVEAEGQETSKTVRSAVNIFLVLYSGVILMSRSASLRNLSVGILGVLLIAEIVYFSGNSLKKREAFTREELKEEGVGLRDGTVEAAKYLKEKDTTFYRIEKNYASGVAAHQSTNDAKVQNYYGTRSYHSFNQLNYVRFLESVKLLQKNHEQSSRWLMGVVDSPLMQRLCNVKYFLAKGVNSSDMQRSNLDSVAMFGDVKVFALKDNLPLGVTFDQYILEEDYEKLDSLTKQITVLQAVNIPKAIESGLNGLTRIASGTLPSEGVTYDALRDWMNRLKQDTLQINSFSDNRIQGIIDLDAPKMLFMAIPFDRGWEAKVDGRIATIKKVDAGLMGIMLQKGRHEVVLEFAPPTVKEGSYVAIASVLLWGLGLVFFSVRRKKLVEEQKNEPES